VSIKILKAGILDTIQDNGRYGYQHLGINPGGAMDKFAATIANLLVDNEPDNAVIELHFPAPVFLFQKPGLVALSGADFLASINGEPVPVNCPLWVNKNSILHFQTPVSGARVYLAVHGGLQLSPWLGSFSTHTKAAIGGINGRALKKDDELSFKENNFSPVLSEKEFFILPWKADNDWEKNNRGELLILPGHEWNRLTASGRENFFMTSFMITRQSDRMGYRLNNIPLTVMTKEEIISSGVSAGTIQLLPDGKLIILMADHQATGGYPRLAHVISAHHSRLAQMKAGDKLHFKMTNQQTAEALFIKQQQHLQQLKNACTLRLKEFTDVC
jgi:antagonist of KipI